MSDVTAGTLRRVGHKGADLIAPGNTHASFDAALEAGVDMIEFDVLPEDPAAPATSRLVLAHDYSHDLRHAPSLEEGLAYLAGEAFSAIELVVDLKGAGYEDRVVAALREHDLIGRTLVSTMEKESLPRLRALEPTLRLGWSVPKTKRDYMASTLTKVPALGMLVYGRAVLPGRAATAIRTGFCDAVMAYWRLVTPRLVAAAHAAGGEIYAWTVDDPAQIERLAAMGVHGVITNDPRLFS
jgi:glycerophosphoryl diester phosphodiesterase